MKFFIFALLLTQISYAADNGKIKDTPVMSSYPANDGGPAVGGAYNSANVGSSTVMSIPPQTYNENQYYYGADIPETVEANPVETGRPLSVHSLEDEITVDEEQPALPPNIHRVSSRPHSDRNADSPTTQQSVHPSENEMTVADDQPPQNDIETDVPAIQSHPDTASEHPHVEPDELSCFCAIPVISQCIGLGYALAGHTEIAKESQKYFSQTCLYPIRAPYELARGRKKEFRESTQVLKQCGKELADHVPVVAHCKGLMHLAKGEKEEAIEAFILGTKPLITIPPSVVVSLFASPIAGVATGLALAVAYDEIVTQLESAIRKKKLYRGSSKLIRLLWTKFQIKRLKRKLKEAGKSKYQIEKEVAEFVSHELAALGIKTSSDEAIKILIEQISKFVISGGHG